MSVVNIWTNLIIRTSDFNKHSEVLIGPEVLVVTVQSDPKSPCRDNSSNVSKNIYSSTALRNDPVIQEYFILRHYSSLAMLYFYSNICISIVSHFTDDRNTADILRRHKTQSKTCWILESNSESLNSNVLLWSKRSEVNFLQIDFLRFSPNPLPYMNL